MRRASGVLLLAALALHALVTKVPYGLLPEMLFACHVATFLMAVGLLAGSRWLTGAAFLFHVGVGIWAYLLDVAATHTTTPTSVLVHVLPLAVGFGELRRAPLSRSAELAAFGLFALLLPVSYFVTPPSLNVNLSHKPWPPVERFMPGLASTWAINLAAVLVSLLFWGALVRRLEAHRASFEVRRG